MIPLTSDRRDVPSVKTGALIVGNSDDEQDDALFIIHKVGAVLNVARDMDATRLCEDEIETAQVGLIDGPGNEITAYCAAVLTLCDLLKRHNVLICCHTGNSRSVVVAMMYLCLTESKRPQYQTLMSCWTTWDTMLTRVRIQAEDPNINPHPAHRDAYEKIPYGVLSAFL